MQQFSNAQAAMRPVAAKPRSADSDRLGHTQKRFGLWLAALLALAVVLRVRGLVAFPFEQDELYTWLEGRDLFNTDLKPGIAGRPLYFLIQHALLAVMPVTPLAMRALPFLLGIAGVVMTALLAKRVFGSTAALVTTAIVAVAPWQLQASTFARYWSLVYLASVTFVFLLWRAYASNRARDYWLTLFVLFIGSATHPSFVFGAFGATLGISLVREDGRFGLRWPSRQAWLNLWVPYGAFLALAMTALRLTGSEDSFQNWGGRGIIATLRLIPAVVDWLTPAIAVAAAIGGALFLVSSRPDYRRWGAVAVVGVVVPLALLIVASMRTAVYSDYALPLAPIIYVSVGGLIALGVERAAHKGVAAIAATLVLMAGMAPATASHLVSGTRFDYRPALRYIDRADPSRTVITWPLVVAAHYAPDLKLKPLRMSTASLDSSLVQEGEFWLVGSLNRFGLIEDDRNRVMQWVTRHCLIEHQQAATRWDYRVYRVHVYRCQVRPPGGGAL